MKILDIPQSGKHGLSVSQGGRFGQIRRALVIPTNPRSADQNDQRAIFGQVSTRWDALTQAKRDAWTAAASTVMSRSRLGQNGPLTGNQLFMKLNTVLATFGQDQLDDPPATPQFPAIAPTNLVITNNAGVIALKLTCPSDPGENTIVRASKPVNQGVNRCPDTVILGVCPPPATGSSTITTLYTTKYGVPPVGKKVFVQVNQYVNGWEDLPITFSAIVPASL